MHAVEGLLNSQWYELRGLDENAGVNENASVNACPHTNNGCHMYWWRFYEAHDSLTQCTVNQIAMWSLCKGSRYKYAHPTLLN